jgi:hypothetical protein
MTDQLEPTIDEQPEIEEAEDPGPMVTGPDGEPMPAKGLVLGIEKFRKPGPKYYRLILIDQIRGEAWLAEENTTEFPTKGGIVEVGRELARQLGVRRFSEVTR